MLQLLLLRNRSCGWPCDESVSREGHWVSGSAAQFYSAQRDRAPDKGDAYTLPDERENSIISEDAVLLLPGMG